MLGPSGHERAILAALDGVGATTFATVIDLTHGYALLRLTGDKASAVLSKLCPIDLSARTTPDGTAFRTALAGLLVTIVRDDVAGGRSYLCYCERSSGQYLFDTLMEAGNEFGVDVDGYPYPDKEILMGTPERQVVLNVTCPDRVGIVHALSGFLAGRGLTSWRASSSAILRASSFLRASRRRYLRPLSVGQLRSEFAPLARQFPTSRDLHDSSDRPAVLVFVSRLCHSLNDLLYRHRIGAPQANVVAVVPNHEDFEPLTESYGVEFHHLPVTPETQASREGKLVALADDPGVELVVLARYMQVLSGPTVERFDGKPIDINHSLLPSFKGAPPYQQAHERAFKPIKATAHYITTDLDEGPSSSKKWRGSTTHDRPEELRSMAAENRMRGPGPGCKVALAAPGNGERAQHSRLPLKLPLSGRFDAAPTMLADAGWDLLGFSIFPTAEWSNIRRNNPHSGSTKRSRGPPMSSAPSATVPQSCARVGAVLAEQNDEWAMAKRYMGSESLAKARLRRVDGQRSARHPFWVRNANRGCPSIRSNPHLEVLSRSRNP